MKQKKIKYKHRAMSDPYDTSNYVNIRQTQLNVSNYKRNHRNLTADINFAFGKYCKHRPKDLGCHSARYLLLSTRKILHFLCSSYSLSALHFEIRKSLSFI